MRSAAHPSFEKLRIAILGAARDLGLRLRHDGDVQEGRLYFSQPLLRRFPLKTDTVGFARKEIHQTFIADHVGVSLQQVFGFVGGTGFPDVGYFYASVRNFSVFKVRKSVGAGLRVQTTDMLLRLHYGI